MLCLPLEDRLRCSLTCRRLAEAITSSQLLHDVWLDIAGDEMETARSVLVNSRRQYTKLVLYKADLSGFDSQFWEKIGANLRVLELKKCSWSTHVFYAILQQCPRLESLKLVGDASRKISIDDFVLPESACSEKLRESLSHLRHLHLDIELTAEILELLLGLMSSVTYLSLSSWFERDSDFFERLPSILDTNGITRTGASFLSEAIGSGKYIEFLRRTSGKLEELQIHHGCLTASVYSAIINLTNLRSLTLAFPSRADASYLEKLVSSSPDLEILKLKYVQGLRDEDIAHLLEFKKLRTLTLNSLFRSKITEPVKYRFREISTLVELNLTAFDVSTGMMRSLGLLKNLRTLVLGECWDSECFEAICGSFEKLTELDLGTVCNLRDADGIKLCRFKELRSLTFTGGYGFNDLTFKRGVGSRAMKSLVIHDCSLTDAGLVSIATHHDRLERLDLIDCKRITDAGVVALLKNEPRLKYLYLNDSTFVQCERRIISKNLCPRMRNFHIYRG